MAGGVEHSAAVVWMSWCKMTASQREHVRLTDVRITSITMVVSFRRLLASWPQVIEKTEDEHHAIYEMLLLLN